MARNKNNYFQMKMREHREEIERLQAELESATEAEQQATEAAKQEAETTRQERDAVEAARKAAEEERERLESLLGDEERERQVLAEKLEATEKAASTHQVATRRRLGALSALVIIAVVITLATSIGSTDVVVQTTTTVPPTTTTKPVPTSTQPLATTTTTTTTTTTLPPKPTLPEPVTTINAIEVLTDGYEWGETGERVQLLQQVLGVAVDGIYRGPTRSMHLAALEERGLVVVGVPAPPTTTTTSTTTTTEAPRLTIETGKSVEASLAEGTRDQWHFEAVAGAEVTVRMTGFDTHLRLYDPDGELVVENDDHNEHFESALWFRVVEAGEYRIDAGGYDDVHHGAYTLTLEGAAVNIGACLDIALPESIKPCSMGIPAHAELMVGARDAWTFVGVRGSQVQIEMTGFDTHLRLFDPDGELMVENDDHNEHYESFLVAGLCSTGRYTIEAGGYADAHGGEYALTFLGGETPFEAITRSCND